MWGPILRVLQSLSNISFCHYWFNRFFTQKNFNQLQTLSEVQRKLSPFKLQTSRLIKLFPFYSLPFRSSPLFFSSFPVSIDPLTSLTSSPLFLFLSFLSLLFSWAAHLLWSFGFNMTESCGSPDPLQLGRTGWGSRNREMEGRWKAALSLWGFAFPLRRSLPQGATCRQDSERTHGHVMSPSPAPKI